MFGVASTACPLDSWKVTGTTGCKHILSPQTNSQPNCQGRQ